MNLQGHALGALMLPLCWAVPARAQTVERANAAASRAEAPTQVTRDRFALLAESRTYLQFFRRALAPGAGGAVVTSDYGSPLTQYLLVQARNVDSPWHPDSIDMEVSAWGQLWPTSSRFERPFDGDVQTANIGYRAGPVVVRGGRQLVAGGAARFARFDGLLLSVTLPAGLSVTGYGGWAVLPRWDALTGYQRLGVAERELLGARDLRLSRATHWLSGGRLGYQSPNLNAAASFHEQHEEGGIERRQLGLDADAALGKRADAGGRTLFDLDGRHLAEGRLWLDARPLSSLGLGLEAARIKPALLLSRQSVLSVFATGAYDELGGSGSVRLLDFLRLEASGYVELYGEGRPGARSEATAHFDVPGQRRTALWLGYTRLLVAENGYHALRASLSRDLSDKLYSTLESYGYFYDRAVLGYRASAAYSGTLRYAVNDETEVLWGASLFRSPYARLDAQTLVRLSYSLDASPGRQR